MNKFNWVSLFLLALLTASFSFSAYYFNNKLKAQSDSIGQLSASFEGSKKELNKSVSQLYFKLDEQAAQLSLKVDQTASQLSTKLEQTDKSLNQKLDTKTSKSEVLKTLNNCLYYSGDYDGVQNIPRTGNQVCAAYQKVCTSAKFIDSSSGTVINGSCADGGISEKMSAYCCSQ